MYGWSSFKAKAWLNSATLDVDGKKTIIFQDGQRIEWNNQGDQFNNLMMGTIGHQLTGKIEFNDYKNNLYGFYDLGSVKKKTQDYFQGQILIQGMKICDIYGNYMGYMDFNGKRYFDTRMTEIFYFPSKPLKKKALPSDSCRRPDSITLEEGLVKEAQLMKEELEDIQRKDKKLREARNKRRNEGGKKFANIC